MTRVQELYTSILRSTMGLLHLCIGVLLLLVIGTRSCNGDSCGRIFTEDTVLEEDDYVCQPIRSQDFQFFLNRLKKALWRNWNAYTFIYSLPNSNEPPEESGIALCPTERKKILGYFKNHGLTLCWIVFPHRQAIEMAKCNGEECCGDKTRCDPGGYSLKKYLVYCDAIYTDEDGCLIGTEKLDDPTPATFDDSDFIDSSRRKREEYDSYANATVNDRKRREGSTCPPNKSYFAFKHDFLPSTCSCRRCDC